MSADRLEQAKLRRDIALFEYWSALHSPQGDAFGRREARMDKAQQDIADAEVEIEWIRKRRAVARAWREMQAKNDSGHPVVGSVPAKAPKPYKPGSVPPETVDPGEFVEHWDAEENSDVAPDVPPARKGASDPRDPNPVEAEHVYSQLLQNYPPESIAWVKQRGIHWVGPVLIPLDRVDVDDEESWAASHQGAAVRRFARGIDSGTGHTHPAVLVQAPDRRAIVIDGHHRFLAYRSLGRPVRAYVGYVDKVTPEMMETHSSQIHQGSDPGNR